MPAAGGAGEDAAGESVHGPVPEVAVEGGSARLAGDMGGLGVGGRDCVFGQGAGWVGTGAGQVGLLVSRHGPGEQPPRLAILLALAGSLLGCGPILGLDGLTSAASRLIPSNSIPGASSSSILTVVSNVGFRDPDLSIRLSVTCTPCSYIVSAATR